ncbi:MAG: hypothetical protein ACREP1_05340, partial [Rhodanobacteraceae bacterium]
YRLLTESLLGLHREGDHLAFAPCVPDDWRRWSADWRHGSTHYHIEFVRQPGDTGVADVSVDGELQSGRSIDLVDDGHTHEVLVRFARMGGSEAAATNDERATSRDASGAR